MRDPLQLESLSRKMSRLELREGPDILKFSGNIVKSSPETVILHSQNSCLETRPNYESVHRNTRRLGKTLPILPDHQEDIWLTEAVGENVNQDVKRLRKEVEHHEIRLHKLQNFCLIFESYPVWLLSLHVTNTKSVYDREFQD